MKFSLARNYRGAASPESAAAEPTGEPLNPYLAAAEIEALATGSAVRVKRYGLVFAGEVVSAGPIPPLRDGRRVVRGLDNQTKPDLGARRVKVRLQLTGRSRVVEVKARDLIRPAGVQA